MTRASTFATLGFAAVLLAGCGDHPLALRNEVPVALPDAGPPLASTWPWFSNDTTIQYERPDWMGELPDELLLSDLSIPGTHETMARYAGVWGAAQCQTVTLAGQLGAGIRAFDIRLRHARDSLFLYHADINQYGVFDTDVLAVVERFLADHPDETVIMRVQKTGTDTDNRRTFADTFEWYRDSLRYTPIFWRGDPPGAFDGAPRLGEVRGKIVVLQDFAGTDGEGNRFGFPWSDLRIEGTYVMAWTHQSFDAKWKNVRAYIDSAMTQDPSGWFVGFPVGSTWIHPIDVAHGIWVLFPPYYEVGLNERTYRYLTSCYDNHRYGQSGYETQCPPYRLDEGEHGRVGMIMSDFPGAGLIDAVIAENGLPRRLVDNPAVAVAGGPYVAEEGTPVVFDASASSDHEHDPLAYRWDVDGDSVYDTPWSADPTAAHTWFDDYEGIAQVQVTEAPPSPADEDVAAVTVMNVPPDVVIDSVSVAVPGYLLPGAAARFHGSFTDPGYPDTHTARWRFGDQTTLTGTLAETNDPPEGRGTVADTHVFRAPGLYRVAMEVLDDDGGVGIDTIEIRVLSAAEALAFIDGHVRGLPDSVFRGPADNRKDALSNKLAAVRAMLAAADLNGALNKLRHDIRAKLDGFEDGTSQDDWIIDPAAQQQLCLMLDALVNWMDGSKRDQAAASR
jgi:hypothetical protein